MSGDVQPRKRKDKKRRKDDGEQVPIQTHSTLTTNSSSDDVNIHVHKEGGTGGGICAKLVFFFLFSALVILIGLIITEYRGLTDVDTADTESRFSQIFEGWIDSSSTRDGVRKREALDDIVDERDEDEFDNISEDDEREPHDSTEEDEEENEPSEEKSSEGVEEDEGTQEDDEDQSVEASNEEQEEQDEEENEIEASEEDEQAKYEDNESEEKEDEEEEASEDEKAGEDEDEDEQTTDNIESEEDTNVYRKVVGKASEGDAQDKADEDAESGEKESVVTKSRETRDVEDGNELAPEENQQESAGSIDPTSRGAEDSDSDKQSDEDDYENSNITSKDDFKIRGEIDEAQKSVKNNSAYAIKLFDKILQKHPTSPRSLYGKALALDYLADQRRSNEILDQALQLYMQLFNTENVPHALFEMAAERCIVRMRFVGQYGKVIKVHKQLIKRFPNNPKHSNDLAVTYLTINRVEEARTVLQHVLSKWPNDGFALVHFGFILKTTDNKLPEAVHYLKKGMQTKAKGVVDGRFYFHLGDALARLGRHDEAMAVYEEGVTNKVFLSKYQRSLYNVPRLTGKPWWKLDELPYLDLVRLLRENWRKIRAEGLSVLNQEGYFQDESENLKDTGDWKQFELFARGQKNARNCQKCPFTCDVIDKIPEARGCRRGQTKFSVMHPGTHVWPHCGPTNCRLRTHLGLKVPPKTFIRVAGETRSWKEGEIMIFDDSFEHEVWHNGTEFRLVLIVDIWHPELTSLEKKNLSPI